MIVSFKVCVSLLIFCLVDLSIVVSGILKPPTIIVLLLISSFIFISICVTYCGAPMLGAYIFIIVISSSWIVPWSLCSVLLCLLVYFIWYKYCNSCFLLVSVCMKYFFSGPSLLVCMCPLFWSGSLVDSIYRGLVFVSIQPVFVFWLGHSTHLNLM